MSLFNIAVLLFLISHFRETSLCWVWQILLISGPPGLGKTTLAHVVAKQAGYKVMEINAR